MCRDDMRDIYSYISGEILRDDLCDIYFYICGVFFRLWDFDVTCDVFGDGMIALHAEQRQRVGGLGHTANQTVFNSWTTLVLMRRLVKH